ncbi:hypothetical protein C2I27_03520 [Priestia megaterium]|uniref:hypothetical protein n=1 Tax=Priestia megaterium TaxID=1404 RepID=UPI000D512103|nr:hypothetical protein [Priestia megaterium]PVC74968.1 hypothetical protein C2I27_03520 [Priestia megaterium]
MNVNDEREYVLLSWKWSYNKDILRFWGTLTDDKEERSYSGYNVDTDSCERYTKQELKERGHLFWEGQKLHELHRDESYAIKLSDLLVLGRKFSVIYI